MIERLGGLAFAALAAVFFCGCESVKSASAGAEYVNKFRGPAGVPDISDGWNVRMELVPEFPWYYLSIGISPTENAMVEQGVCFDLGYSFARNADKTDTSIVWPVIKPELGVWIWGETESQIGLSGGIELGVGWELGREQVMLDAGYSWRYKLGIMHGEELHVEALSARFTWRF